MAERISLSGLWLGSFSYPQGQGATTPFMAKIEDRDGSLTGETVEPNIMSFTGDTLEAFLAGSHSSAAVDFTKTYDGAGDAAHSVDYVGRLSADGNSVSGVWSLADWDGTFEMHREAVWEEAEAEEAVVVKAG